MKKNINPQKRKGFTLAETVIAVALLGILLVTICGVFVHSTRAIKKGRYRIAGLNLAEKKISEIRNLFALLSDNGTIICSQILFSSEDYPGIVSYSDSVTDDGSTVAPATEINIWQTPYRPLEIKGTENIPQTGDYEFTVLMEDYITPDAPENIDGIKKITVTVAWMEPQVGEQTLTTKTILVKPPE